MKVRNKVGHVVEVKRRAVYGGPRRFGKPWRLRQLGTTAQTAFMERWYGALRGLVAPLRRRTRCLSWSHTRHRGKVWLMVSLYNFVMPRSDVHCGHTRGVGLPLEDGAVAPREGQHVTGLERCQCRKARIQRNPIGCALLVWVRLKVLAAQTGRTVYQLKHGLLDDYLVQQLKNSSLRMVLA